MRDMQKPRRGEQAQLVIKISSFMECTVVEDQFEPEVSRAYMDGYIEIDSADAVRFELDFNALIKKYAR